MQQNSFIANLMSTQERKHCNQVHGQVDV